MLDAGKQLGRYRICSSLIAGYMGEVYLAEDTRLHRKVALKILSSEIASDKDRLLRSVFHHLRQLFTEMKRQCCAINEITAS
ncbi:MAG: hypothetical protein LC768_04095 [Acidobacteria bacterium]|nr:hypothetical protein [Acidobacteriota bacterium]MCA1637506.1 hypothetical protein [Acidobacteriota bacterium]